MPDERLGVRHPGRDGALERLGRAHGVAAAEQGLTEEPERPRIRRPEPGRTDHDRLRFRHQIARGEIHATDREEDRRVLSVPRAGLAPDLQDQVALLSLETTALLAKLGESVTQGDRARRLRLGTPRSQGVVESRRHASGAQDIADGERAEIS